MVIVTPRSDPLALDEDRRRSSRIVEPDFYARRRRTLGMKVLHTFVEFSIFRVQAHRTSTAFSSDDEIVYEGWRFYEGVLTWKYTFI